MQVTWTSNKLPTLRSMDLFPSPDEMKVRVENTHTHTYTHTHIHTHTYIYIYVYVCVCVSPLERSNFNPEIEISLGNYPKFQSRFFSKWRLEYTFCICIKISWGIFAWFLWKGRLILSLFYLARVHAFTIMTLQSRFTIRLCTTVHH